jgi:hypothetical protein
MDLLLSRENTTSPSGFVATRSRNRSSKTVSSMTVAVAIEELRLRASRMTPRA